MSASFLLSLKFRIYLQVMLKIRFNRIGRRNKVYYRIVVQEHTAAPGGRHVAVVGSHDPHTKTTVLKEDAIRHWLNVGAQPSDTVYNLLVAKGIILGKKRPKGKPVQQQEAGANDAGDAVEGAESADAAESQEEAAESQEEAKEAREVEASEKEKEDA